MLAEFSMAMSGLQWLALAATVRHTAAVAETAAAGFGDPESHWRTTAALARFFYVRTPLQASYGRALVGVPSGTPGSFVSGSPTPPCARPPHLAMGSGFTAHKGGHAMATTSHVRATQYPLIERAAIDAAEQWLQHAPESLADWCDTRFHASSRLYKFAETVEYKAAFEQAYAHRIGQAIVGVHHE